MQRFIHKENGRKIAYTEYGDAEGRPVFYFHGTPGSRLEGNFADEAGKKLGYRIIALDRPGYGMSDSQDDRQILDWPDDVRAAAEYLGIGKFGVIGVSGGGAYALACARAIPELLEFCVVMGSWAPVAEEPALWAQMAPLDRFFGRLSRSVRWPFYLAFSGIGGAAKWLPAKAFARSLDSSLCDADREALADPALAEFFKEDIKEAFQQGVRGPADDAILLYKPWGFQIDEINAPVDLFHGTEDKFAPFAYAEYLDENLLYSQLHAYAGEGHFHMMHLFEEVLRRMSDVQNR